jgi:hypothetical protein
MNESTELPLAEFVIIQLNHGLFLKDAYAPFSLGGNCTDPWKAENFISDPALLARTLVLLKDKHPELAVLHMTWRVEQIYANHACHYPVSLITQEGLLDPIPPDWLHSWPIFECTPEGKEQARTHFKSGMPSVSAMPADSRVRQKVEELILSFDLFLQNGQPGDFVRSFFSPEGRAGFVLLRGNTVLQMLG